MWIDSEGGLHTVALPDPTILFDGPIVTVLESLSSTDRELLVGFVEEQMEEVAKAVEASPSLYGTGSGSPPPTEASVRVAGDAGRADVERSISGLDLMWRMDFLFALEDLIDSLST